MNKTLALCFLTLLCGCSQPASPGASGTPAAVATPANQDFSALTDKTVKDFPVAPFGGMSKDLAGILGTKLESDKGAFVPMLDTKSGSKFVLAFIPGADPTEVDGRQPSQMKVSGQLKPIEDAGLAKTLEGKLGGSLLQLAGKPVYLVVDQDPWPAGGATPTPKGTP